MLVTSRCDGDEHTYTQWARLGCVLQNKQLPGVEEHGPGPPLIPDHGCLPA